jgi:glycogen debranching enzyme
LPYAPYYGTVDATPLFLLLCARHAQWTGRLDLFRDLRVNLSSALDWLDNYGDADGDGYLDYTAQTPSGLINEAWKDSSDAMVGEGGAQAQPPIAPAEVQGYAYAARAELAEIYEQAGESDIAGRLRQQGEDLKQRFNKDYWLPDKGIYAMALEKGMRPLEVVSSNAGQVLWSGIADHDKAHTTAHRLLQDDMFSGWGVRTLSTNEECYNPISYHLGSVWPHDNAIIFGGFRRLGHDDGLCIFQSLVEAAHHFTNARLPELFGGFDRARFPGPVHYPVACHPQAWASGAIPYMLQESLGLQPRGFEKRLLVHRPMLPPSIPQVELTHLGVGEGECHLRFSRNPDGSADLDVVGARDLDIQLTNNP